MVLSAYSHHGWRGKSPIGPACNKPEILTVALKDGSQACNNQG